jgi:hypothetical protein
MPIARISVRKPLAPPTLGIQVKLARTFPARPGGQAALARSVCQVIERVSTTPHKPIAPQAMASIGSQGRPAPKWDLLSINRFVNSRAGSEERDATANAELSLIESRGVKPPRRE